MSVHRHPTFYFAWVFLLFLFPTLTMGQPQTDQRTVLVIGKAYSKNIDTATAKQRAIDDALTTAVEAASLSLMEPGEAATRFEELSRIILGNEKSFIQSYEVLTGGTEVDNRFRILVNATVSVDSIRQRLDALAEETPAPPEPETNARRVLLLLAEQQTERGPVHYWWREEDQPVTIVSETAMARVLSREGMEVIPHEPLFQDPDTVARIRFNPYIEPGEAVVVGRQLGADVVIIGTAVARRSLTVMGEEQRSFSATVSVRAFSTEGGKLVAEVTQTSMGSDRDALAGRRAALEKAAEAGGEQLAGELTNAWGPPAAEAGLRVVVGGTGNLGNFVMFRRELQSIAGVERIRLQEMRSNEAVLQVTYDGDGPALARALEEQNFDPFTLKIYEAVSGEVRLELVAP